MIAMPIQTRLRILEFIRTHQTATVREISLALGVTGANVRHHLVILESTDVIGLQGQRREGRGRPVNVYGLSRRMLGDALDELAHVLLAEWLSTLPVENHDEVLGALARRLGDIDAQSLDSPLPKRLIETTARLNALHYQSRWEAGPTGPRFIFNHCPYAAIIADHPELCRMDSFLLEQRIGATAVQTVKLGQTSRGETYCAFRIGV
jgi:predicted ArsR family transcriptional regulator